MKKCFVICELGDEGSNVRKKCDALFKNIFDVISRERRKAGAAIDFMRADKLIVSKITSSILRSIRDSDFMVADLTNHNPNVFYELAICHAILKPVVLIMEKRSDQGGAGKIPFDIADDHVIFYDDISQSENMLQLKSRIDEKIDRIISGDFVVENPLSNIFSLGASPSAGDTATFFSNYKNDMISLIKKMDNIESMLLKKDQSTIDARYIEGQEDAFKALTQATLLANEEVRSSRFFPDSVLSQNEYVTAIRHRVLGRDGRPPLKKYYRIVSLNNKDKIHDVLTHMADFMGRPFELFLTPEENAFELVIIDNREAFIHFYRKEYVIASTLHIRERIIVEKFKEIYDQLAANLGSESRNGHYLDLSSVNASNYVECTEKIRKIFNDKFGSPASEKSETAGH
ncbi:MAG: hypothetical protein HQL98_01625 [Magnetococcales bacterium]|nr:hypothetical protein [Magnetococcales bacterium]